MPNGFVLGDRGLGSSGDTHPGWIRVHATLGAYLITGASAVGQGHVAKGAPRDDAFVVRSMGPWLAVAVSDGVGSRPMSRYGATYAADLLTAWLLRPFAPPPALPQTAPSQLGTDPPATGKPSRLVRSVPPAFAEPAEHEGVMEKSRPTPAQVGKRVKDSLRQWLGQASVGNALPTDLRQAGTMSWWPAPGVRASVPGSRVRPTGLDAQAVSASSGAIPSPEPDLVAIMRKAFQETHLGLREQARRLNLELSDLGCTGLALLLNTELGRGVAGQVGDGAVLGLTAQLKVKELVESAESEDPQLVYTLNRPTFEKYLALQVIEPIASHPYVAFYVMTDGLSMDIMYAPMDVMESWAAAIDKNLRASGSAAQAAAGLLNWLTTYQGSLDDRTLVAITRLESEHASSLANGEAAERT